MVYMSRRGGGGHHHHRSSGGGSGYRGGSQDMSRRKPMAIVGPGDVFASETPKAYSPLGYGIPDSPQVLRPEDFNNDAPLPSCPVRPPQYLIKPLGPTFLDTESEKPNFQGVSTRAQTPRDNTVQLPDGRIDPTYRIVSQDATAKKPLTLGKNVISDLDNNGIYFEKYLKRERETTTEPEDTKEVKKQKRDFRIKFDGEEEGDINEDTVKPENVLRMVDQSLVEYTPEKKYELQNQNQQQHQVYSREGSVPPQPSQPSHAPVHPRYGDDYYEHHQQRYRERERRERDRDRERERERERERDRERDRDRDRDAAAYNSYKYPPAPPHLRDSYKIPPNSAPSRSSNPGGAPSLPPPRQPYYEDYDFRYHSPTRHSRDYYDDRYYNDRRAPPPPPVGSPPRPIGRGPPPPPPPHPAMRRDYDFDYALPPPPPGSQGPPSPIPHDYRYERGHMRSPSGPPPPRRYDDRRRY